MFTRSEYMNDPSHLIGADPKARTAAHRRYYAQFVDAAVIARVVNTLGAEALLASKDEHLNDIPLTRWDRLTQNLGPLPASFEAAGDYPTRSGLVCVAKEAARQFIESKRAEG